MNNRATLARKWRDYEKKKKIYLLSYHFDAIMARYEKSLHNVAQLRN
jgi:hypothetical protein